MNRKKLSPRGARLLAIGCVLATCGPFLHLQFPSIPDFFVGLSAGMGLGIMLGVLIWHKKLSKAA